jgi:hypothetical protein
MLVEGWLLLLLVVLVLLLLLLLLLLDDVMRMWVMLQIPHRKIAHLELLMPLTSSFSNHPARKNTMPKLNQTNPPHIYLCMKQPLSFSPHLTYPI